MTTRENDTLAAAVKSWRGKVSVKNAAPVLGIPYRTLENVEAGRGFPYPQLLRIAMQAVSVEQEQDQ